MLASTRISLTVDRSDDEVVGAMGACWDPHNQTWFLDVGVELEPFAGWLPGGDRVDFSCQVSPDAEEPKGIPLSAFLVRVKGVINAGLTDAVWVRAEIRKIQVAKSRHIYLELEERDDGGQSIASTKGVIWAGRASSIHAKFSKGTGGDLKPDIKVLIKVKADFHPVHGFDLIIEDIDPSFTLGDLLAKLRAIRETLKAEDIYESNKRLSPPEEYVRVAVICPATSAGQGDFRSEADRLQKAGLCGFDYFTATFQGGEASPSIRDAVRAVFDTHRVRPYDALAIIRGGGSVTDLAWLNDLRLTRWICRVPIPVFTGIGHERDSTILDEVAHRRFDTPSKVALQIAHVIRDNAWNAIANLERIKTQVSRLLTHRETTLTIQRERLDEQVARLLENAEREVSQWDREIRVAASHHIRGVEQSLDFAVDRLKEAAKDAICGGELGLQRSLEALTHRSQLQLGMMKAEIERQSQAVAHRAEARLGGVGTDLEQLSQAVALQSQRTLASASRDLDHLRDGIGVECEHWVAMASSSLGNILETVQSRTQAMHRDAHAQIESHARTIVGMGPQSTLQRGYAIARDPEGSPVGSKAEARKHKRLTIQFRDGGLAVENRENLGNLINE